MSSRSADRLGMTASLKLALWFTALLVAVSLGAYVLTYLLVDNSIDHAWEQAQARLASGASWNDIMPSGAVGDEPPLILAVDDDFRRAFLGFIIPAVFVSMAGAWLLTYCSIKPVRDIVDAVEHILETGELETRVPVPGDRGQPRRMVGMFNDLLERNHKLVLGMRESLDHVAHDLRTPLARMRASAETAVQAPDQPPASLEALSDCLEESELILAMLNGLMDLAEAQAGAMNLNVEDLSVRELVERVVTVYEFVAEEHDIRVVVEVQDGLRVSADPTRMHQVLANLLDNALKYSSAGSSVTIRAAREADNIVLTVADQGMGIPGKEIEHIWERLYRADQSRSKRGLGLGLTLVKAFVEAHGGTVTVTSEVGKGSTFSVVLPRKAPAAG